MRLPLDEELTACLIVYNESKVIERCLQSIKKVTNNIIVVHDGQCRDDTLEICSAYGCRVFVREHVGMCEGHRAWTYAKVTTPWILQIDADEFLSDELINNFDLLIKDDSVACYELLWRYSDGRRYRTEKWPFKKALFQKELIKYLGFPHEEVRTEGVIKKLFYLIEHKPNYDNYSLNSFWEKHSKWRKIHAQYLLKDYDTLDR